MRKKVEKLANKLSYGIADCIQTDFGLPGLNNPQHQNVFICQMIDSIRRVDFVRMITHRDIHPDRADGLSPAFDPLRAARLKQQAGDFDEACWLVFLFVHFGRHPVSGYRYAREFYSAMGQRAPWTFAAVKADIAGMKAWLDQNEKQLRRGSQRGFGNHRKYLSLSGTKQNGTGHAFETYVKWVSATGNHANLFDLALAQSNNDPAQAFEKLYRSMRSVASFGRIGRFDYLTMIQKLGFASIKPGRPYLDASTNGPNKGARLLFEGGARQLSFAELERRTQILGAHLGVGMQEMEDAMCNWGKNPDVYKYFRG
ncbi:MAG: hypothetical protein ACN6O1_12370 [Comamonas sp.]|uniref:alpha-glutamyl/putrescinyl thymine pyrophosphorylase clade 3 protein n=1 Tax=Comamonas sp. TaxID=34028 RepID=UPI003D119F81